MEFGLKDKVAIVCASSKGLGKAVAESLAREGAKIVLCARSEEPLRLAAAEIRKATGATTLDLVADVTDHSQLERLVAEVIKRWGTVHILVNNAGGPPAGPFEAHNMATWRKAVELSLLSVVSLCSLVVPLMKRQRWGRILSITSIAAREPVDGLILSNSSRAAVLGLSKSLANELGPWNITVNSVCPGYTLTNRLVELAEADASSSGKKVQEIYHGWESRTPMGRLGKPEDLAALVTFLASERASYITGTAIAVDGGMVRGIF